MEEAGELDLQRVLLYVAYLLGSVSWNADRAAPFAAVALAVNGRMAVGA